MKSSFSLFPYENLPKGKQGLIDPYGNFILLGNTNDPAYHQQKIMLYAQQQNLNLVDSFEKKKPELIKPELYQFRKNVYDYKSLIIDFAGYCNYEIYPTTNFAAIEIPDRKVVGKRITKEQQLTLIKLVEINKNDLDSLLPLFLENNPFLSQEAHSLVASKIKVKSFMKE